MKWSLLCGDARDVLRTLPADSVNCIVTSPPYWGLRSYAPDMVQMRANLTDEERERVMAELAKLRVFPIADAP